MLNNVWVAESSHSLILGNCPGTQFPCNSKRHWTRHYFNSWFRRALRDTLLQIYEFLFSSHYFFSHVEYFICCSHCVSLSRCSLICAVLCMDLSVVCCNYQFICFSSLPLLPPSASQPALTLPSLKFFWVGGGRRRGSQVASRIW